MDDSIGSNQQLGQVKYAKRAGAESIYKDATRNTANDNEASAKTESNPASCDYTAPYYKEDAEENQGI